MTLALPLAHTYSSDSTHRAQIVRVEQFAKVRVSGGGSLTAPPWDGATGGILAVHADELTVDVARGVSMDAKGYVGGIADALVLSGSFPTTYKPGGESSQGMPPTDSVWFNTTAPCVSGGPQSGCGGITKPGRVASAGGGGGYGTPGGAGGSSQDFRGGLGGVAFGDSGLGTIFFGAGGGSGHSGAAPLGNGGGGGGIVIVDADRLALNVPDAVSAAGAAGQAAWDIHGAGGGGAGGSVYASYKTTFDGRANVDVHGGAGGAAPPGRPAGGVGGSGRIAIVGR